MRLVIARCQVDYAGRLSAHLPEALRLLLLKADGSVLVHSDAGGYKPQMWMTPPCTLRTGVDDEGREQWTVGADKSDDTLRITMFEVVSDSEHELGTDPGLRKDGVEKHLQELLADQPGSIAPGLTLVRREYPTAIGPVDLMCREGVLAVEVDLSPDGATDAAPGEVIDGAPAGRHVAVEIKRRATIDAVEQLTRYLELLNRDPLLRPVRGILAAQTIAPQARTLAEDRDITCAIVDYDALRGLDDPEGRLF